MKSITTLLATFLILCTIKAQVYVNQDAVGNNDGTSWTNAYNDLQTAMDSSTEGSIFWISTGVYKPTGATPQETHFKTEKFFEYYGGFKGTESALNERDWINNPTILSGDINGDDVPDEFRNFRTDNAHHVLWIEPNNGITILDGIVIEGGNTRMDVPNSSNIEEVLPWLGGGLLIRASSELSNCTFRQNIGRNGAAAYIFMRDDSINHTTIRNCIIENNSSLEGTFRIMYAEDCQIESCIFNNNESQNSGGGLHLIAVDTQISDCTFENNTAGNGGGVSILQLPYFGLIQPKLSFNNCQFHNNVARSSFGGGGLDFANRTANARLLIDSCSFIGNKSTITHGGGIYLGNEDNNIDTVESILHVTIKNTDFEKNIAQQNGGAIANWNFTDTINFLVDNCQFTSNQTIEDNPSLGGAGILNAGFGSKGSLNYSIMNSDFLNNTTQGISGGIWNSSTTTFNNGPKGIVQNCKFYENEAKYCCGGMGNALDEIIIDQCEFKDNKTFGLHPAIPGAGGLGFVLTAKAQVKNTSLINNNSTEEGSAIYIYQSSDIQLENVLIADHQGNSALNTDSKTSLINTTIIDNEMGLSLRRNADVNLQNTLFKNEENYTSSGRITMTSTGGNLCSDSSLVSFLTVTGNHPDLNNINPQLNADFMPTHGSPCVDAGNPKNVSLTKDITGNNRIQGNGIDIGAFESPFTSAIKDVIWDANQFNVYPNPVHDELQFKIKDHELTPVRIQLFDALGQLILDQNNNATIQMRHLANGTYFIIVTTNKEKFASKILKKR